jgi:hypothetical protein
MVRIPSIISGCGVGYYCVAVFIVEKDLDTNDLLIDVSGLAMKLRRRKRQETLQTLELSKLLINLENPLNHQVHEQAHEALNL